MDIICRSPEKLKQNSHALALS